MRKAVKSKTDKRAYSLYCTWDQAEYMRWWLKEKGVVPEKPWVVKRNVNPGE